MTGKKTKKKKKQEPDFGMEFYWEFDAIVFKREGKEVLEVKEKIKVPRMTTRMMLKYRRQLKEKFASVLANIKPGEEAKALFEAGLDVEMLGESIVDIMLPGLVDRIHPQSFQELSDKILAVEATTLNPPETTKPKSSTNETKES